MLCKFSLSTSKHVIPKKDKIQRKFRGFVYFLEFGTCQAEEEENVLFLVVSNWVM